MRRISRLFSQAGAGHTLKGKYRVYGEGSVHHNGRPCEHGLDLQSHPVIFRHDYDSIWHYWRSNIATWWMTEFTLPKVAPQLYRVQAGSLDRDAVKWEGRLDKIVHRLFGPPFARVPTVEAGLKPEHSLYDRSLD